jgi:hypothetical protein
MGQVFSVTVLLPVSYHQINGGTHNLHYIFQATVIITCK